LRVRDPKSHRCKKYWVAVVLGVVLSERLVMGKSKERVMHRQWTKVRSNKQRHPRGENEDEKRAEKLKSIKEYSGATEKS